MGVNPGKTGPQGIEQGFWQARGGQNGSALYGLSGAVCELGGKGLGDAVAPSCSLPDGRALAVVSGTLKLGEHETRRESMLEDFVWPLVVGIVLMAIQRFIEWLTGRRGGG